MAKPFFGRKPMRKENPNRINRDIRGVYKIRIVGDEVENGEYSFDEGLEMAEDLGLDLVEISATQNPPICRICDYQKFLYDKKKKEKDNKKNNKQGVLKEIKISPNIGDHDMNFKINHANEFLENGDKVKVSIFFRGRSIIYKDQGEIAMLKFAQQTDEKGRLEKMPQMEGKIMSMIIAPKKK